MPFFIPFLVSAAFVAAGVGVNELEKKSRREIEEAENRRVEAERVERENRERAQRWAREAAWAEEQRRAALAREQAAVEAARKEEARVQAVLRAALEARKRAEEADMALVHGIPPQERPTRADIECVRTRYGYQSSRFNVAIVGESGMGKSTLLNSLRGLLPSDPGAAIPGANTPTITGWRYFTHQGLFIFDALLVVFCDRFTQTTGTLVSNAEECGIPIFLVRTKADQLIQNIQEDKKMDLPPRKSYVVSRRTMRNFVVNKDRQDMLCEEALIGDVVSLSHKTLSCR